MKEIYTLNDLQNWGRQKSAPPIRLGVLGDPVAHSFSPRMQNAALRACKIKIQYGGFQIARSELTEALQLLRELDFVGVNLTIPHKIPALQCLDEVDENARGIGAVNTIQDRE